MRVLGLSALPASAILIGLAVTALSALVQGTVGFGAALVAVPLLSLVHPDLAPVPQLLLGFPMGLTMAWRERHALRPPEVAWIVAGMLPGIAVGTVLLRVASPRALDLLIGCMVLVAVVLILSGLRVRHTAGAQLAAGATSATFGLVSSIGGPPIALLYRDRSGPTMRANLGLIFTSGVVLAVGGRIAAGAIAWHDLALALLFLPALLLGLWSSRFLTSRVEGRPLRVAVLLLSSAAAMGLLWRALA